MANNLQSYLQGSFPNMMGGLLSDNAPLFASKPPKAAAPAADAAPAAPVQNKQFASKPQVAAVPSAQTDDQKLLQEKQAATDAQIKAKLAEEANALEGQKAGALETRESVNRSKALMEQADRDTWAEPAFNPTKNQPMEIGKIFSLIATMGVMSGGGGKMGAMQAMNAMTGMLKGYQAGDQEAYERAKIEYDEGMKTIQAHNAQILKHLETALSLEATDREAAAIEKDLSTRLTGQSSVSTALGNAGKWQDVYELHLRASDLHNEISKIREQANIAADRDAAIYEREANIAKLRAQLSQENWQGKQGDQPAFVQQFTGAQLPAAQATAVANAAKSFSEAENLAGIVKANNNFVGRQGQVNKFIQQYVDSAKSGTPEPTSNDPSDQAALVFAKRYAAFQVAYERALAGQARGFTQQFQNRWNNLTGLDQFNASGFLDLMDQFKTEMVSTAATYSPKINRGNLKSMGDHIREQTGEGAATEAAPTITTQEQYNSLPSGSIYIEDGKQYRKP